MRKLSLAAVVVSLLSAAVASIVVAQEMPELPKPVKEHQWLKQFVGEWEHEGEANMPGAPPMKCKGVEKVAALGDFWIVSELKNDIMGETMHGRLTVGYDPEKKKYIGTWVDSMTNTLWIYQGSVDDTGKILTLEAEGPDMMNPKSGKKVKFRDVTEFKSADERVTSSSAEGPDGKWVVFMSGTATRKK